MISSDPRSAVFHALKHDLRREILSLLEGGPTSYTGLLRALGVESGLLAYHLRSMGFDDKSNLLNFVHSKLPP